MRHIISAVVENKPGVLARVSGLFSARGFNIESLAVGETEIPERSRMTIVVSGDDSVVEQIRKIKTTRKLLDVLYELEPQQVLDGTNASGFVFMVNNMRLQMQLLHEDDLLVFLADLRDGMRAYTSVKSCNVMRQARPGSSVQLSADCSVDWITLRERSPGQ